MFDFTVQHVYGSNLGLTNFFFRHVCLFGMLYNAFLRSFFFHSLVKLLSAHAGAALLLALRLKYLLIHKNGVSYAISSGKTSRMY